MRRYEVVFVLAPTLSEDEVDQNIATYTQIAEQEGASIVSMDKWGKRKLAFPVKKYTEGYYVVLTVEEPVARAVQELERRFKVTDSVIRFLTVRIDLELKRAEKARKKREKRPSAKRRRRV
jgi:small subunit ribosomal protein S6